VNDRRSEKKERNHAGMGVSGVFHIFMANYYSLLKYLKRKKENQ